MSRRTCKWTLDDTHGNKWDTECGHAFEFTTDGPEENGARFCQYCGGRLVTVAPAVDGPDGFRG